MEKDYCPECCIPTNHTILFEKKIGSENDDDFHWHEYYRTIQCNGCDNIQFKVVYGDEHMFDYKDDVGNYYDDKKYYPHSINGHKPLENSHSIPRKIRIVYSETLEAIKSNCYLLSGVGLRAVIEAVAIEQKITGRTLEVKINNLLRSNLITTRDASRLHGIRFLGNDSVHDMEVPSTIKIRVALDIAENLLKNLYLIDIDANQHLDTIINKYDDFKNMLLRKFSVKNSGEEKSIKDIFGKDYRRIEPNYIENFTQQILDEINNGVITLITPVSLPTQEIDGNTVQLFKKNEIADNELSDFDDF